MMKEDERGSYGIGWRDQEQRMRVRKDGLINGK